MRKKYEKANFKVVSLDFCDIVTASIGDGDNRRDDDIFDLDGGVPAEVVIIRRINVVFQRIRGSRQSRCHTKTQAKCDDLAYTQRYTRRNTN